MIKGLTVLLCLVFSTSFAHQGNSVLVDQWHNIELTVKWDSNWPTEHCVDINKVYGLTYRFESENDMAYDLHVHPNKTTNNFETFYFSKVKSVKTKREEIITDKAGTYCFNFIPVKKLKRNSVIKLQYLLTEETGEYEKSS